MRKILLGLAAVAAAFAFADFDGSYILPLNHTAIQYNTAPVTDRVAGYSNNCAKASQVGIRRPARLPERGAEGSRVPESSQVLVYSKTSFQAPRISPENAARAVLHGRRLRRLGAWRRRTRDRLGRSPPGRDLLHDGPGSGPKPRIDRRDECLQCHASGGTLGVPGLMVRSVLRGAVGHAAVPCGRLRHGPSQPACRSAGAAGT